jgi:hypothetical protein
MSDQQHADYDHTPTPFLSYQMYDVNADPREVVREPGSPRLYAVHRAGASVSSGSLRVTLEGPMRKRDGGRGQHSRVLVVDLGHQQPDWLTFLIRDARRRLLPLNRPAPTTGREADDA